MKRFLRRMDRYWFAAAPASSLAALRILVGGYMLYYLVTRYSTLIRIAETGSTLFEPVGVVTWLDVPLSSMTFATLLNVTILANVAFVLGWGFRVSGPLFCCLVTCIFSYKNSWGMIHHSHNLLILHILILGFTRAADALSADRFLRWCCVKPPVEAECGVSSSSGNGEWRYGWPIRLMCTVTACCYFLAGVAKVAGPLGWSWASGEALRSQLAVDALRKDLLGDGAPALFLILYDHAYLLTIMGIATLVLEIGAPVFMINRRAAVLWSVAMFGFHWGIYFMMGIRFRYQLVGIAFASCLVRHRMQSSEVHRVPATAALERETRESAVESVVPAHARPISPCT